MSDNVLEVSSIDDTDNDITSRAAVEEFWCLCKHLLHSEGHAEECIANASRDGDEERIGKLGQILDDIRSLRQEAVLMAYEFQDAVGCPRCQGDILENDNDAVSDTPYRTSFRRFLNYNEKNKVFLVVINKEKIKARIIIPIYNDISNFIDAKAKIELVGVIDEENDVVEFSPIIGGSYLKYEDKIRSELDEVFKLIDEYDEMETEAI